MSAITAGVNSFLIVFGAGVIYSFVTSDWNYMTNFCGVGLVAGAGATLLATALEK